MSADSTTASAHRRRVTKPLMERRRRARINFCLSQLKEMVIAEPTNGADNIEGRTCRLEKADILEMTVQHVKKLTNLVGSKKVYNAPFQDGYRRCVAEVAKFMKQRNQLISADDEKMWSLLLRHLQQTFPSQFVDCSHSPKTNSNVIAVSCQLKDVPSTKNKEYLQLSTGGATIVSNQSNDGHCYVVHSLNVKPAKIHLQFKPQLSPKSEDCLLENEDLRWRMAEHHSSQHASEAMWRPW